MMLLEAKEGVAKQLWWGEGGFLKSLSIFLLFGFAQLGISFALSKFPEEIQLWISIALFLSGVCVYWIFRKRLDILVRKSTSMPLSHWKFFIPLVISFIMIIGAAKPINKAVKHFYPYWAHSCTVLIACIGAGIIWNSLLRLRVPLWYRGLATFCVFLVFG